MEKWNIACLHRFRIASAEQSRQTGKKKVRRNSIIPLLPAYRQAGTIPIPNGKFVTNYNLEYYHYFLNRTHVNYYSSKSSISF